MNNYVRGKYDSDINKIAYNQYAKKINKNVKTVEEAINNAKEILEIETINGTEFSNDFWSSVYTQAEDKGTDELGSVKLCINTNEPLYSELPIAKTLEAFASNILNKDEEGIKDSENKKIKIYTSKEEFEKIEKEERKMYDMAVGNGADSVNTSNVNEEFIMFMLPKNYKKVKTYDLSNIKRIDKEFGKEYPTIHDYCEGYISLNTKRKELKEQLKTETKNKNELIKQIKMVSRQLGTIKTDINTCLMELVRPIIWKQPLKDEGCPDYDCFDFFDKDHVKELLRIKRGNDFQNDLDCIVYDLEQIIGQCEFTDRQEEVLYFWRNGKTQEEIADILDVKQPLISNTINKIVNKIIKQYEEIYSDWYYLNIVKGKYKKCNKCGEIKLIQYFNTKKDNKDGYNNICKQCYKTNNK